MLGQGTDQVVRAVMTFLQSRDIEKPFGTDSVRRLES